MNAFGVGVCGGVGIPPSSTVGNRRDDRVRGGVDEEAQESDAYCAPR